MYQESEDRLDLRVTGIVQGVGFRWWTVHLARRLGVRGIVRNRPDGSVEVRAAGTPGALSELRQALAEGPPHAAVRGLEPIPSEGGLPPDFRAER